MPKEDEGLTIIPFLDKSKPKDLERLCDILYQSHFLILPTEFDALGIVFCEASAYGVPSIAANVGGVSQPVREGKNGFLLPPTATAEDYAEKIKAVFSDKESYIKLRASSRNEYETRLNWDVWSEKVNKILEKIVINYKKKDAL
jgi:glycosyltransferase involved in cell wall biosynthesis